MHKEQQVAHTEPQSYFTNRDWLANLASTLFQNKVKLQELVTLDEFKALVKDLDYYSDSSHVFSSDL